MIRKITGFISDAWHIGLLTLSAIVIGNLTHGQILVSQNFSTNPPAGWTVTNLSATSSVTWKFNNPGTRTITGGAPGFDANFAILDSDNQGASSSSGEDAALESPVFDASQAGGYRLEYDNQYRNVGSTPEGTPTVEVWNGTVWTAVLTYPTTSSDGYINPANHKSIDITTAAGGSANAKVRFHWVNGSWDYWWAIDNVTITRVNCISPTVTFTTVPNCANNQFSINVNVTNMGNATSIGITDGTATYGPATATGSIFAGPYASGSSKTITLTHNVNTVCNVTSAALVYNCPAPNDECINAIAFPPILADGNCISVVANTISSTQSMVGCVGTADDDVWYSFVCPIGATKIYFANTTVSGNTDRVTEFFSGTCGNLTSILCSDDENNTLTGLTPGNTYYFRIYTYSSNVSSQVSVCLKTDPPMTYSSSVTEQPTTTSVTAGAQNQNIIRVKVVTAGGTFPLSLTQLDFNTTGTTNVADIVNAKVYYTGTSTTFSTTTPFGNTVVSPNGNFSVMGNLVLPGGATTTNNYFFLAYDLACNATASNVLDAQCTSVVVGSAQIPTATNPAGTRAIAALATPTFTSPAAGSVAIGTASLEAGRINITGSNCVTSVSEVKFNAGTSPSADIAQARCYYTTTSSGVETTTPFGSTIIHPAGDMVFTGTQAVTANSSNYFWLAYDVDCAATATTLDSLYATPVSITSNNGTNTVAPLAANKKKGIIAVAPAYVATTTTSVAAGTAGLSIGRTGINGNLCANTVTQVKFNTSTSVTSDISQAKCYYTTSTTFSTATPFGAAVITPNGDITFTGSQSIATGTGNYFWLAYDVPCTGVVGDSLVAVPVSITADGNTISVATPTTNAKKGITPAMAQNYTATTTTNVAAGTGVLSMGRINVTGGVCANTATQVKFNTATSVASDISQAKCYYTTSATFSTATPFGAAVITPNGDITFTGSQSIATGTGNYFWLAYDVSCTAVVGDSLVAVPVSITADGNTALIATPSTNTKKGITAATVPGYTATTTTNIASGSVALSMGRISIVGNICSNTVTQVKFNTAASVAADISQAKCYYTTSATFSTATPFGAVIVNPGGDITFTGSQSIATGTGNYFWLAYDVSCTGVVGDSLVAVPVSITADGNTALVATPSTNAKKGIIASSSVAPSYTAATTTSVPAGTAALAMGRTNISGSSCLSNVSQVKFNTSSSPGADIASARCFYTTTTAFSSAIPFGLPTSGPNGEITFSGSQAIAPGSGNYFWLAYDVSCTGVLGDSLTAVPVSITANGNAFVISTPASNAKKGIVALTVYNTIADGDWGNSSTWACGAPPVGSVNVSINNNVTVTTSGNVAANITVAAGKTLTIASGDLTMGPIGGGNKTFTNNGTLTVSGGVFNVNGNMLINAGSGFNQSAGNINIDGNAAGVTANSVASGTNLLDIGSSNINWIGGTLTIVDPHAASGTNYSLYYNASDASVEVSTAHTFAFGNGISSDAAASTNGFYVNNYVGSYRINLGNVVVNGPSSAGNRFVTSAYSFPIKGNLTISNNGEFRPGLVVFLGGNLTVDAGSTFTSLGTLNLASFSGTSTSTGVTIPQVISGGGVYRNATSAPTANFASLTINNTSSAGVTFDANSLLNGTNTGTVSGTLTMTAGTVNVGSNTFVLGTSPTATGTYSYTAGMIVGKFKRWMSAATGANAFDLGSAFGSKKAIINFTTAPTTGGSLTASFNPADPGSNGLPLTEGSNTYTNVSTLGYWIISAGDGLAGGTYTAVFTGAGFNDVSDYTKLAIGKRATSSDPWALVGTLVAPTGSNSNFVLSRTGMTGFSDFAILNTQVPLEIKLASFTGYNSGAVNNLNWTTASERDASHFEVMRSENGKTFEKIGKVDARNKISGDKYTFVDANPLEGRNFYKLSMVDRDGKSVLSNVIELSSKVGSGVAITIHPNPVSNLMQINIAGKVDGKATLLILDIVGKIIKTINPTGNNIAVDMSNMPAGTYIVKYMDNSNTFVTKVLKD